MDQAGSSSEPLIVPATVDGELPIQNVEVRVSNKRFYILTLFASLGFMQCAVWNTWGPITQSVKTAYPSWTNKTVGMMSMWGTITMITGLLPFTYLLTKKGLRISIIITAFLMAFGTGLRVFTTEESSFTLLAHACAILNGFAGVILGAAPALLSATWFPPHERTTATGIGCTFNQLGNAGGFFIGPMIVRDNSMIPNLLQHYINNYMWIVMGICNGIFVLVLYHFPERPEHPPSITSALHRVKRPVMTDIMATLKNGNLWILMIPYSLSIGLNVAWSSVIEINLEYVGLKQNEAAIIGLLVTFGGVFVAVVASVFTDVLFGNIKLTIIVLLSIATIGFTWFLLLMNGCLPYSSWQLYLAVVTGASFSYGCSPLFFELAVEMAHPVAEGIIGCFLNMCWNLISVAFLIVLQSTDDVIWMDYVLAVQGGVSIFVMLFVKEEYKRTNFDRSCSHEADEEEEEPLADNERPISSYGAI